MRFPEVLSRVLHWRWLPFLLPVSFTLFFVGAAVLLIPDSLEGGGNSNEEEAGEGKSKDSTGDSATGFDSTEDQSGKSAGVNRTTGKSRITSSSRSFRSTPSRTTRPPHNPRVVPPRTGPRSGLTSPTTTGSLPSLDEAMGPVKTPPAPGVAVEPAPTPPEPAPEPSPTE